MTLINEVAFVDSQNLRRKNQPLALCASFRLIGVTRSTHINTYVNVYEYFRTFIWLLTTF